MKRATKAAKAKWPEVCFTCKAQPTGTFQDGSPMFSCHRSDPKAHVARGEDGKVLA